MNREFRLEPWNLLQIYSEFLYEYRQCCLDSSKDHCKEHYTNLIKRKAEEFSRIRKLTPGEQSILDLLEIRIYNENTSTF